MKIIEAMKRVKANKQKVQDLKEKIKNASANYQHETPIYENPAEQIKSMVQACLDLIQENDKLLGDIQRTNLVTLVPIEIGGKTITKSIAEWVWRRREYAKADQEVMSMLTDRGLKEGVMQTSTGTMEVKLVRHFKPEERDAILAEFRGEPFAIDSALEIINATTDLIPS